MTYILAFLVLLLSAAAYGAWVDADGSGLESINVSDISGEYGGQPSLKLDSSGMPAIAWVYDNGTAETQDIVYAKWNGTGWVDADGAGTGGLIVYTDTVISRDPVLQLEPSGNPCIAWRNYISNNLYHVYFLRFASGSWVDVDGSGNESVDAFPGTISAQAMDFGIYNSLPYIACSGLNDSMYFFQQSGFAWVDADLTGRESGMFYGATTYPNHPSLGIDAAGYPHIAWSSEYGEEIYYLRWNGTAWVDADGSGQESINISNNALKSTVPILKLDAAGRPNILWRQETASGYSMYFMKHDGTGWTDVDGSGLESIEVLGMNTAFTYDMQLDSYGYPHVVWGNSSTWGGDIYYQKWTGLEWVDADGTARESVRAYNDSTHSATPKLELDAGGRPHIVWIHGIDVFSYNVYYMKWIDNTPTITPTAQPSAAATLTVTATMTPALANTATQSVTQVYTATPTITVTAAITLSFTVTAAVSFTSTGTPTVTVLPESLYPPLTITAEGSFPGRDDGSIGIVYELSRRASVDIKIFTVSGEIVFEKKDIPAEAGANIFSWDLKNSKDAKVASAVYIYMLSAEAGPEKAACTGKLAVVR